MKDARTVRKLEEVIRLTEQQYEDYRNGGLKISRGPDKDINFRDIAHRILDATLSFKGTAPSSPYRQASIPPARVSALKAKSSIRSRG